MALRSSVALLALLAANVLQPARPLAQAAPADGAPRISQQDFKRLIATGAVIIVDTRIVEAYRQAHIPSAVALPLEGQASWPPSYEATVEMLKASRKPIVTYCA